MVSQGEGSVLYRGRQCFPFHSSQTCVYVCISPGLPYRTVHMADVPTLHRSGSNPPALDTLPSCGRAGHGRRPAVSRPFGREGNSGPFQEERQSAQGHPRRDTRERGALATRANARLHAHMSCIWSSLRRGPGALSVAYSVGKPVHARAVRLCRLRGPILKALGARPGSHVRRTR